MRDTTTSHLHLAPALRHERRPAPAAEAPPRRDAVRREPVEGTGTPAARRIRSQVSDAAVVSRWVSDLAAR